MNRNKFNKIAAPLSIISFFVLSICISRFSIAEDVKKNTPLKILQSAEEISVLSQRLVKDYFYVAKDLNTIQAGKQIDKGKKKIDEHIAYLDKHIKKPEVLETLAFMSTTHQEIDQILNAPYTEDNAYLLMDMNEALLEGSEYIVEHIQKKTYVAHEMLDVVEHQLFLIERLAKLYIAAQSGIYDYNSRRQMEIAIQDFDKGLSRIASHRYPEKQKIEVEKLQKRWQGSKKLYKKVETGKLPRSVFLATELMGYALKSLQEYHLSI